ncbi:MAG: hypothetical protein OEY49_13180 [Candidatus Heimdallarchaeota archaeon]|nr:hypothetical protein [Candidatus Heimdallarchaeota archaeon]
MLSASALMSSGLGGFVSTIGGSAYYYLQNKIENYLEQRRNAAEAEKRRYIIHEMPFTCNEVDSDGCSGVYKGLKGLKIHWANNRQCLAGN